MPIKRKTGGDLTADDRESGDACLHNTHCSKPEIGGILYR